MDKRREPRLAVEQLLSVTLLTQPPVRHMALTRNASGRGLALQFPAAVDPGTAVRIETDDSMLLGEVVHCRQESAGYLVGIELDQVLTGLTELGKRLQEYAEPSHAPLTPRL